MEASTAATLIGLSSAIGRAIPAATSVRGGGVRVQIHAEGPSSGRPPWRRFILPAATSAAPLPPPPIYTEFQNNQEEYEMRSGNEHQTADHAHAPVTPAFPFPMRIPSFLLPEHLHLGNKEFVEGIATSSHVDLIQELLLYRVHLEHGFSTEINVGFVEVILPEGQDNETHC
jgi:hypothetical protein